MIVTGAFKVAPISRLRQFGRRTRSMLLSSTGRWHRAWRYAAGTWTESDADFIAYDANNRRGCFALEAIDVGGVLDYARDRWKDHPALEAYAWEATARVGYKWDSGGDASCAAQEWALDLIAEYAKADGVELIEVE